jgi:hypothetical protein
MPVAGDKVRASDQQNGTLETIGDSIAIRKANTESVTSSTTLQDDDDFVVSLPVGTYRVLAYVHASGIEAADIRIAWEFTGACVAARSSLGPAEAMTDRETTNVVCRGNTYTTEQVYGIDTTGSTAIYEDLHFEVTATGTLRMRWAQGTSNATSTDLTTASRMYVIRMG